MNNNFSNNNNNSLKEMFNTFSNTPMRTMTNIEPLNIQSNYNEPTYNQSNTGTMKNIFFGIFIVILLAVLGFNVFNYLAQGTDIVSSIVSPIVYVIAMLSGDTAKTTLQHTSQGTQVIANESSNFLQTLLTYITTIFTNSVQFITDTSTSGIDFLQSSIKQDKITSINGTKTKNQNESQDNEEDNVLKNERTLETRVQEVSNSIKDLIIKKEDNLPHPTRSDSQQHGFCYVGKEKNLRHCAKVSSNSKCMSGDIFPTMDLCINPKLR